MGVAPVGLSALKEDAKREVNGALRGNSNAVFFMRAESHVNITKLLQNYVVFVK
jgi:hypothetical protein